MKQSQLSIDEFVFIQNEIEGLNEEQKSRMISELSQLGSEGIELLMHSRKKG